MSKVCPGCGKIVKSRFCPECGTEVNPPPDKDSETKDHLRKKIELPTGRVFWITAVVAAAVLVILGIYGASALFDYFTSGLTDLYLNGQ